MGYSASLLSSRTLGDRPERVPAPLTEGKAEGPLKLSLRNTNLSSPMMTALCCKPTCINCTSAFTTTIIAAMSRLGHAAGSKGAHYTANLGGALVRGAWAESNPGATPSGSALPWNELIRKWGKHTGGGESILGAD